MGARAVCDADPDPHRPSARVDAACRGRPGVRATDARPRTVSAGFITQAARRVEGPSYSGFLDLGRSRQAPAGMTAPFEEALRAEMPALAERAAARVYP